MGGGGGGSERRKRRKQYRRCRRSLFSPPRALDVAPPLFLITSSTQARNWLGQYSDYDYNPVTYRIFCYSYFLSLEMRPFKLSRNNVALRVDKFL